MICSAITPRENHNYVAFFLTLTCNLRCPYCINQHDKTSNGRRDRDKSMSADEWITAANRLVLRDDLPLTLQGGEPTLFPGFYQFVKEVKPEIKMDLMTNMMFDVNRFINEVPVWRFTREAPYAAIRVSYHPGQNDIDDIIKKTFVMQEAGFRVGVYAIETPNKELRLHVEQIKEKCLGMGIDFRTKEYLGVYDGILYGTFKYDNCVCGTRMKRCECRTSELIVDPAGLIYRCHADLYSGRNPIAHILDPDFDADALDKFRPCKFYGACNPCDVKIKTNRFQIFGHTSVEIQNIGE